MRWQFGRGAEIKAQVAALEGQLVKRGRRLEEWLDGVIIHRTSGSLLARRGQARLPVRAF